MSNWQTRISTDHGGTFAGALIVGAQPTGATTGGFDVSRYNGVNFAGQDAKTRRATTLGGAYSDATDGACAATYPLMLLFPWYTKNSTSAKNTGATNPEYVMATPATFSSKSLVWITSSQQDITPSISGNPGLATGGNCLTTWKGTYLAAILSFAGTRKLVTSVNSGTNWTDRGAAGTTASYIRLLRLQGTPRQFFFPAATVVKYTSDWGATVVSKSTPSATDILGAEPYG